MTLRLSETDKCRPAFAVKRTCRIKINAGRLPQANIMIDMNRLQCIHLVYMNKVKHFKRTSTNFSDSDDNERAIDKVLLQQRNRQDVFYLIL